MTGKTPGIGDMGDTHLEELLRADAAAIIDDDLDDESASVSCEQVATARSRPPASAHSPSQVYSIRVPVERLEQLRMLASDRGLAPTAMMRHWVLTQLDVELRKQAATASLAAPSPTDAAGYNTSPQPRDTGSERLEKVAAALMDVSAQLANTVTIFAELFSRLGPVNEVTANNMRSLTGVPPATAWPYPVSSRSLDALPAASFGLPPHMSSVNNYLMKGLAELQSTVRHASSWPGIADFDLDTLYEAADEELPSS
jgi:hypothetical protein